MKRGEIRWYKFKPPDKKRPVLMSREKINTHPVEKVNTHPQQLILINYSFLEVFSKVHFSTLNADF